MSTSSSTITGASSCATRRREYWLAESKRLGADWISIATLVSAVLHNLAGPPS